MGLCSKSATLVKEDQCRVVAGIVGGTDVFAVPPTGYTNSLCYVCLPLVFDQLEAESRLAKVLRLYLLVVTPLTTIMDE